MDTPIPAPRARTRSLFVGDVGIGGDNPVRVQSMTNTDTRDVDTTLAQISALASAGCEIVRLAVLDLEASMALKKICAATPVPLIADIHFDSRLAVQAVEAGVRGLRINPGNIGGADKVDRVVDAARAAGVPIRIGVNSGSVDKDLLRKHGGPTPAAMVESALEHVRLLEERGFDAIKISLKSSSVLGTVAAYRLMAKTVDYPLHIGVTEAGTAMRGAVKSSVGLGILLAEGIGDTLRVSLTADPVEEMLVAWEILRANFDLVLVNDALRVTKPTLGAPADSHKASAYMAVFQQVGFCKRNDSCASGMGRFRGDLRGGGGECHNRFYPGGQGGQCPGCPG